MEQEGKQDTAEESSHEAWVVETRHVARVKRAGQVNVAQNINKGSNASSVHLKWQANACKYEFSQALPIYSLQ